MIPQLGFSEMMVLGLLAIIVVGPKDLPKLMRTLGGWMAKVRSMGQEFKDAFDEMGAESELKELRKEIEDLKNVGNITNLGDKELASDLRNLDTELRAATDLSSPKAGE